MNAEHRLPLDLKGKQSLLGLACVRFIVEVNVELFRHYRRHSVARRDSGKGQQAFEVVRPVERFTPLRLVEQAGLLAQCGAEDDSRVISDQMSKTADEAVHLLV